MKNNLKTKGLFIILMAILVIAGSTLYTTVKATDVNELINETNTTVVAEDDSIENKTNTVTEEPIVAEPEVITPKLNSKITFTGDTYWYHNAKKVRKSYTDDKLGCGIISIIVKNKTANVYVSGEGWIKENQIKKLDKFITLKFDKTEDGGILSTLKIDGEFVQVDSKNEAVAKYENGVLVAGLNGTTNVSFIKKDGTTVEAIVTTTTAGMSINLPEKSVSASLVSDTTIANKVDIHVDADANAKLVLEEGKVGVTAEGNGKLNVTVDDKEIIDATASGSGTISGGLDGVTANGTASQTLSLLQKITLSLQERANAKIDKTQAAVGAGGTAAVNDKEVANADAEIEYTYGAEDPTGSIKGQVAGNEFNKSGRIPVISAFKSLLAKIAK